MSFVDSINNYAKKLFAIEKNINVEDIGLDVTLFLSKNNVTQIYFDTKSNKNSYSFIDNYIYISESLIKTKDYKKINNLLNNPKDTIEIILLHEVSHAIHHQNMYEKNYSNFNGFINLQTKFDTHLLSEIPVTIKHNYNTPQIELENFLAYQKGNSISEWLHYNFTEGFADCTSIVLKTLKDNLNKDQRNILIEAIKTYREENYKEQKELPNELILNEKNKTLEIWNGKHTASSYCNYESLKHLKGSLFSQFSNEELTSMSKPVLYSFINAEVLNGLHESINKEVKENVLFAKQFNDYCRKSNNQTIEEWLNNFKELIVNYKTENVLKFARENYYKEHSVDFEDLKTGKNNNEDINKVLKNPSDLLSLVSSEEGLKRAKAIVVMNEIIPDMRTLKKNYPQYEKQIKANFKEMPENGYNIKSNNEIKSEILKEKFTKDSISLLKKYQYDFSIPCHHTNKPQMNLSLNQEPIKETTKPNIIGNISAIRRHLNNNQNDLKFKVY